MRRFSLVATAVIVALTVTASAGHAATRTVLAGWAGGPGVFAQLDTNSFFRSTLTVHQGDTVRWDVRGFHDIAFLGGKPKPALIVPNVAQPVTALSDATGAPYWFTGQPNLDINPQVAFPVGNSTFSRTSFRGSGLPASDESPLSYKLKFNTRGTFTYYCVVHPGMAGRVKVVSKRTRVPTLKQNAAAARKQLDRLVAVAKKKRALSPIGGPTVEVGRSTSEYSLESFFPETLNAKVGELVTFTMEKATAAEPHTVTFGPAAVTKPLEDGFIRPLPNGAGPPILRIDPRAAYPTTQPGPAPPGYDLTTHGDGLENLGLVDNNPTTPNGAITRVTFTQPGAFRYVCVIHPGMVGTVNVTA